MEIIKHTKSLGTLKIKPIEKKLAKLMIIENHYSHKWNENFGIFKENSEKCKAFLSGRVSKLSVRNIPKLRRFKALQTGDLDAEQSTKRRILNISDFTKRFFMKIKSREKLHISAEKINFKLREKPYPEYNIGKEYLTEYRHNLRLVYRVLRLAYITGLEDDFEVIKKWILKNQTNEEIQNYMKIALSNEYILQRAERKNLQHKVEELYTLFEK